MFVYLMILVEPLRCSAKGGTGHMESPEMEQHSAVQCGEKPCAALPSFCCLSSGFKICTCHSRMEKEITVKLTVPVSMAPRLSTFTAEKTWVFCVCREWKQNEVYFPHLHPKPNSFKRCKCLGVFVPYGETNQDSLQTKGLLSFYGAPPTQYNHHIQMSHQLSVVDPLCSQQPNASYWMLNSLTHSV